jgi:hypothetical protein
LKQRARAAVEAIRDLERLSRRLIDAKVQDWDSLMATP